MANPPDVPYVLPHLRFIFIHLTFRTSRRDALYVPLLHSTSLASQVFSYYPSSALHSALSLALPNPFIPFRSPLPDPFREYKAFFPSSSHG